MGGLVHGSQSALDPVSRALASFVETKGDPEAALKAFTLNPKSLFLPSARGVGLKIHDAP